MDVEAPRNASDVPDNPEVSWWCKILTRMVASIAGVGELSYTLSHNQLIIVYMNNPLIILCFTR